MADQATWPPRRACNPGPVRPPRKAERDRQSGVDMPFFELGGLGETASVCLDVVP
jgi:hypothetical protein